MEVSVEKQEPVSGSSNLPLVVTCLVGDPPGPFSFRLGLYRHYKGGLYTALGLITHHEGKPLVRYVSHTYGGERVRPLLGWPGDPDGFLNRVPLEEGDLVTRFTFVGDLNDTPIAERGL